MTTAAGGRSRGQGLQVWISAGETEEWSDAKARAKLIAEFAKRAKARGRRYFEIFSDSGAFLHKGEVGS